MAFVRLLLLLQLLLSTIGEGQELFAFLFEQKEFAFESIAARDPI